MIKFAIILLYLFSIFLISIVANPAIDCCDKFLDSKKLFKEFFINSLLVFLSHPIPIHNTGGCQFLWLFLNILTWNVESGFSISFSLIRLIIAPDSEFFHKLFPDNCLQNIFSFLACLITSFDQSFILPDLFHPHWFPNASRFKRLWFLELLVSIISPPSKLAIWYAIFCVFDWCKPIKGTILEHLLSITITPGSWSLEVKNGYIMRIDAAIEPIKII